MAHRKELLGRTATFLIPAQKNAKVRDEIISFLNDNFSACTFSDAVYNGTYKKRPEGKFIKYSVSFLGKERIHLFDTFLEKIARQLGEECIWAATGEDDYLVIPI